MANYCAKDLPREQFELIIILEGIVESTGMTAQARSSYLPSEILWGHRFEKLVTYQRDNGQYKIDYSLFQKTYPVITPRCSAKEFYRMKAAGLRTGDADFYFCKNESEEAEAVLFEDSRSSFDCTPLPSPSPRLSDPPTPRRSISPDKRHSGRSSLHGSTLMRNGGGGLIASTPCSSSSTDTQLELPTLPPPHAASPHPRHGTPLIVVESPTSPSPSLNSLTDIVNDGGSRPPSSLRQIAVSSSLGGSVADDDCTTYIDEAESETGEDRQLEERPTTVTEAEASLDRPTRYTPLSNAPSFTCSILSQLSEQTEDESRSKSGSVPSQNGRLYSHHEAPLHYNHCANTRV